MIENSFHHYAIATMAFCIFVTLVSDSSASNLSKCNIPSSIVLQGAGKGLEIKAVKDQDRAVSLDQINLLTRIKWSLVPLIPSLATRDTKVHLYDVDNSKFLTKYGDITEVDFVKFFLGCGRDGKFKVVPAKLLPLEGKSLSDQNSNTSNQNVYVGMTFRPKDTTPSATLKGDLYALEYPR